MSTAYFHNNVKCKAMDSWAVREKKREHGSVEEK